jgi:hypothetical protein
MDYRVLAALFTLLTVIVASGLLVHGLIWLLEHQLDPSLPLRTKAAARVDAIEATLEAIKRGLIRIPRVTSRRIR